MLSVIPAGIFSRLRIFLGRLKPHALPVARRHIVLGSIGAGTGLAVTSMFSHWLLGEVNLWFIAPMGASAVLLFGVPSSPLAQPWSIVGGNVLSALIGVTVGMLVPDAALIGVTVGMLVPDAALACGLAAALAIAGMYFLRCLHPPGGAVALTAILGGAGVHSEGYHFVLTPVLLNSLMLALLAIVFNNLVGRRYPHPLAAEEVKSRAVPLGISVTREDIHAALLEGQFLDIDEDDVQELLENIEQQARQRIATAARR
ncbi:HPP family protein [Klebsiella pneumoniae]|nr:HPP family protein [Klebsiella pneumoniae]